MCRLVREVAHLPLALGAIEAVGFVEALERAGHQSVLAALPVERFPHGCRGPSASASRVCCDGGQL